MAYSWLALPFRWQTVLPGANGRMSLSLGMGLRCGAWFCIRGQPGRLVALENVVQVIVFILAFCFIAKCEGHKVFECIAYTCCLTCSALDLPSFCHNTSQ